MNTHDKIELPPLPNINVGGKDYKQIWFSAGEVDELRRAAIIADRKRRGEPVAWRWSESNGERWFAWTTDWSHHDRAVEMGCLVEYAAPSAPQPAEPIVSDVEAIVRLLERREWADHVATTPLGQRLETAVTVLVGADPQPSGPDKQHPDDAAVDAFAAAMKAKLKRAREEKGRGGWQDMSAAELSAMLREHVEKGDPVDVANLAMMLSLNGQRIVPTEHLKGRRIDDALRGLQASVAVGSDGAWVSIRREARDAAVKLLQELNSA